jgi:hypothetical protein
MNPSVPPPPNDEPFFDKLIRKCSNEPLVPLGTMATCFFLVQGLSAFKQGHKARAQLLMRGRVLAQTVTVLAMASYAFLGLKPHDRPANVEEILGKNASETAAREAHLSALRSEIEQNDKQGK